MKKIVLSLSVVLLTLIVVQSCNNKDECDCESNYTNINLRIKEHNFVFKDYNNNNERYLQANVSSKDTYKIINVDNRNYKNNNQLVAVFYLIDNRLHEIVDGTQINTDLISGSINYYLNNNNQLEVTAFIKDSLNYIPTSIENFETNYITTNDVYKITEEYIGIPSNFLIVVGVINNVTYINNDEMSLLQYAIIDDVKGKCMLPCSNSHGVCQIDGGGNTICNGVSLDCPVEQMKQKVQNESQSSFDFINIETDMRSFRDNYLKKNKNSVSLIKYYYEVGKDIKQNLNLSFAIETFNNLQTFQHIMNSLNNNPNDNSIYLFNSQNINELATYFNQLKQQLTDVDLKNKTNEIINLINTFNNKSNYEVTQVIYSFTFD